MATPGLKAPQNGFDSCRGVLCQATHHFKVSSSIRFEGDPELPPRLSRKDLKDPEQFHQRLVEWLLKQR
jgi:hypothetical protein